MRNGKVRIMLMSFGVVLSAGTFSLPAYVHLDNKIERRVEAVRAEAVEEDKKIQDTLTEIKVDIADMKRILIEWEKHATKN